MYHIDQFYNHTPLSYLMKVAGGKFKKRAFIVNELINLILPHQRLEFREPFAFGAAITFEMMRKTNIHRYWLNDIDPAVSCFWLTVRDSSKELQDYIEQHPPTKDDYMVYRHELLKLKCVPYSKRLIARIAFMKMVVQRISYSGLGTMASKPCSNIDERWNSGNLIKELGVLSVLMNDNSVRVTNHDFEPLLTDTSRQALIYLDPPYFIKGKGLYLHNMDVDDHVRLACVLKKTPHPFVLSYDDCEEVRELYSGWTKFKLLPFQYTSGNQKKPENELLIIRQ